MQDSVDAIKIELTEVVDTVKDDLQFISSGMSYIYVRMCSWSLPFY